MAWPDKTEGYTHCLLVIASSHASLKAYLHSDLHLKDWMAAVKPFAKAPPLVFDHVLSSAAVAGLVARHQEAQQAGTTTTAGAAAAGAGMCGAEGLAKVSLPAAGAGAAGGDTAYASLSDAEIVAMVRGGKLKDHQVRRGGVIVIDDDDDDDEIRRGRRR